MRSIFFVGWSRRLSGFTSRRFYGCYLLRSTMKGSYVLFLWVAAFPPSNTTHYKEQTTFKHTAVRRAINSMASASYKRADLLPAAIGLPQFPSMAAENTQPTCSGRYRISPNTNTKPLTIFKASYFQGNFYVD